MQVEPGLLPPFFQFLQGGFFLGASVGCSIHALLCEQLGLGEEYVLHRITTLFLDGKPVDDIDSAVVRDGATLGLSAAMPGLVGAAMRRGGAFASLRSSITAKEGDASARRGAGVIRMKLFNMVMREIGPEFLKRGITVRSTELIDFFKEQPEAFWHGVTGISLNGVPLERDALTDGDLFSSIDFHGQARRNLSSEHGEREGEAPAALPLEGATRAPFTEWTLLSVLCRSPDDCP
jgi:hypothetical protein